MAGFTVSDLTDYVRENADRIFTAAITQAATLQYPGINIIAGIKNAVICLLYLFVLLML